MSVNLLFPDGTVLRGETADDVLATWGLLQWTPVKDPADVKAALADRVWALSQLPVDPDLPSDEFLDALQMTGLCAVDREAKAAKPTVSRAPWNVRYPDDR